MRNLGVSNALTVVQAECVSGFIDLISLLPSVAVILCGVYWIARRFGFSSECALGIAVGKTSIFAGYFLYLFSGQFTYMVDDWGYAINGVFLSRQPLSPWADHFFLIKRAGGGAHYLYAAFCEAAMRLLGTLYSSPVALHTILSAAAAGACARMAQWTMKWEPSTVRCFFLVCCFHPEVIVWASMYNLKDNLVLCCYILVLYGVWNMQRRLFIAAAICFFAAFCGFLHLRFYSVPLCMGSFLLWGGYVISRHFSSKIFFLILGVLCCGIVGYVSFFTSPILPYVARSEHVQAWERVSIAGGILSADGFSVLSLGVLRVFGLHILSYMPKWIVAFNILSIPLLLVGAKRFVRLNKERTLAAFILILLLVVIFSHALSPWIGTSARHRHQVFFMTALFQFLGILRIIEVWPHIIGRIHEEIRRQRQLVSASEYP